MNIPFNANEYKRFVSNFFVFINVYLMDQLCIWAPEGRRISTSDCRWSRRILGTRWDWIAGEYHSINMPLVIQCFKYLFFISNEGQTLASFRTLLHHQQKWTNGDHEDGLREKKRKVHHRQVEMDLIVEEEQLKVFITTMHSTYSYLCMVDEGQ